MGVRPHTWPIRGKQGMRLPQRIVHLATAAALAATLAVAGCGGVDGLDLNGKVFDWMGVSPSAMAKSSQEPQVAARTPLVLPPDTGRLPEPGSEQTPDSLAQLN